MLMNNYKKKKNYINSVGINKKFKLIIKSRLWLQGFNGLIPRPWMKIPNLVKFT